MRLICPNCDAEYEVDEAAIPDEGRDVLCSACGHSWFQLPAGRLAEKEGEAAHRDSSVADQSLVVPPEEEGAEPPAEPVSADGAGTGHVDDEEPAASADMPAPPMPGGSLNESLMAVLREEAARETEARQQEKTGLETQTEMPLAGSTSSASILPSGDETPPATLSETAFETVPEIDAESNVPTPDTEPTADVEAAVDIGDESDHAADAGGTREAPAGVPPELGPATAAMRKIAKLRGEAEPPADAAESGPENGAEDEDSATGRELLPEIDEINSTLRDARETREVDEGAVAHTIDEGPAPGGGFRDGFLAVIVLVILGVALYLASPFLATKVPALQPALMAYVHAVDGWRIGLDALVQQLSNWVSGVTGGKG